MNPTITVEGDVFEKHCPSRCNNLSFRTVYNTDVLTYNLGNYGIFYYFDRVQIRKGSVLIKNYTCSLSECIFKNIEQLEVFLNF
jgi:hypothetical protein